MPQQIIFATHNANKVQEAAGIIGDSCSITSLKDLQFQAEIPENKGTLKGNAYQKASFVFNYFKSPVFADDSGLEIEALQGEPGVYSARYAKEEANQQNISISEANIQKVLRNLRHSANRSARFRTVIAFVNAYTHTFFEGIINGTITFHPKGKNGFGYDPIFIPAGYTKTFAQMPSQEKNNISHRAIAFHKLATTLQNSF